MAPSHPPQLFQSVSSAAVRRRLSSIVSTKQRPNVTSTFASLTVSPQSYYLFPTLIPHPSQPIWAGIAGSPVDNNSKFEIAISINDSVYSTDFSSAVIPYSPGNAEQNGSEIEKHVLSALRSFAEEHLCKFLGAGITLSLLKEVSFFPFSLTFQFLYVILLGSQSLHASLVGIRYCPNCIPHQAIPDGFYHAPQHQAPHLIHDRFLCPLWR